jgi:outer membrane protein assembly factor BamB
MRVNPHGSVRQPSARPGVAALAVAGLLLVACSGGAGQGGSGYGQGGQGSAAAASGATGSGATSSAGGPASSADGGAPAGTATGPVPVVGPQDWPTYHRTDDRAGAVTGTPTPTGLRPRWKARLDGAVYGQPLLLGDLVVAATEGNSVYGLGLADGRIRWQARLGAPVPLTGLPCGNIDPLGITGTPAYDPGTGSVFVATETAGGHHDLVALDVRNGSVRFRRSLDVVAGRDQRAEQQRGALAVAGGRVYVPFGGLFGDCGNYVGYVTATPVGGSGPTTSYQVPTAREGGIWAASGVAVDAEGGVWVAVGNGASTENPYDGSDSVLHLTADLSARVGFFAPADWGRQNAEDADLGSTGPLLIGPDRVLIAGKTGEVDLLDATRPGGIGGQLASVGDCRGFGGMAWDASGSAAFVPCQGGLLRVDVGRSTLRAGWRAPSNVNGSPVIAGSAVWSLDADGGRLYALDERTGRTLASAAVGRTSRFGSPVVSGRQVLVATLDGVSALDIT